MTRDEGTKLRTQMAAKIALFTLLAGKNPKMCPSNLPVFFANDRILSIFFHSMHLDELKHVVGSETTRFGLLNSFSMWQHKTLNKRLVLVLFNEILQSIYKTDDLTKHTK